MLFKQLVKIVKMLITMINSWNTIYYVVHLTVILI